MSVQCLQLIRQAALQLTGLLEALVHVPFVEIEQLVNIMVQLVAMGVKDFFGAVFERITPTLAGDL